MNTGDRIKELRISNNLTQEELGKKVGVKKSAVQKWESGMTKNLRRSVIEKLSQIFEVNPSYIMGMSNIKNTPSSINKIPDMVAECRDEYNVSFKKIPILGTIAAGTPILAEQNIEDYFGIDKSIGADFALRIKGDSMIDIGIHSGDIAFIKKQSCLDNGEIGAILIEEEATLKRFYLDGGIVVLESENTEFEPMLFAKGNLKILGKLVAVLNIIN